MPSFSDFLNNLIYAPESEQVFNANCSSPTPLCHRFAKFLDSSLDERLGAGCITCPVFDYIPWIVLSFVLVIVIVFLYKKKKK